MDTAELAKKLSEIDALDKWGGHIPQMCKEDKIKVYKLAELLWVERMVKNGKLLVHPDILKQLENQLWVATDLQKKMIWASVIASADGSDSKKRFKTIKDHLVTKYGREWWEDVYKRKTNAWAAKERIRKQTRADSPSISMMTNSTLLFSGYAAEERNNALRMIPSK